MAAEDTYPTLAGTPCGKSNLIPVLVVGLLVGAEGIALSDISTSDGQVRVHGERWQARSREGILSGSRVNVVAVRGLELQVAATDGPTQREETAS